MFGDRSLPSKLLRPPWRRPFFMLWSRMQNCRDPFQRLFFLACCVPLDQQHHGVRIQLEWRHQRAASSSTRRRTRPHRSGACHRPQNVRTGLVWTSVTSRAGCLWVELRGELILGSPLDEALLDHSVSSVRPRVKLELPGSEASCACTPSSFDQVVAAWSSNGRMFPPCFSACLLERNVRL